MIGGRSLYRYYGPPRRRRSPLLGLLLIIAAGYFGSHQLQKQGPLPSAVITGRAQQVIDGDTFHLQNYSIRLWGIDAPERDTPMGPGATQMLQGLLRGRKIICKPIGYSYERLVASCTVNGRDISQVMVRLGWARDLPNRSGRQYEGDEADAKAAHRGMWKI